MRNDDGKWYCGNCSKAVPIGERCPVCGKTEREKA